MESLLSGLPEEAKQADVDSPEVDQSNENPQITSTTDRTIEAKQIESRFIPLDLSELDLATPENWMLLHNYLMIIMNE